MMLVTVGLGLIKACSNEANMLVQHHPTLLNATCWPRLNTTLDNVGRCWLEFKLAKNFRPTCIVCICMYLISLETLSSSAIRLVFMRGVYLAIYKYIKTKKKLINPQTQREY